MMITVTRNYKSHDELFSRSTWNVNGGHVASIITTIFKWRMSARTQAERCLHSSIVLSTECSMPDQTALKTGAAARFQNKWGTCIDVRGRPLTAEGSQIIVYFFKCKLNWTMFLKAVVEDKPFFLIQPIINVNNIEVGLWTTFTT